MSPQPADGLPQVPDGEAYERDGAIGGRSALHGPPGRVSACGKHGKFKSNKSANVTMVGMSAF